MTGKILQQVKKWAAGCVLIFLVAAIPALADEIVFKNQNAPQKGTVVEQTDSDVTIRFPRQAVRSIRKSTDTETGAQDDNQVILEEKNGFHILKIPDHLLQIKASENQTATSGEAQEASSSLPSETKQKAAPLVGDKLLEEEMGAVEGTILWQNKPMQGEVKIVLAKYTGFSMAAVKKMLSSESPADAANKEIFLKTHTDDQGRYSFTRVPPGFYRLFWLPAGETEWIHRLRDKPDFEVAAGSKTFQNIPEKQEAQKPKEGSL